MVLAATIAAESGPIRRFRTAKAYASYTGLTPSDRSTGGRMIHGGIDRAGSSHLRWALGQMVMACQRSRHGPGVAVGNWVRAKQKRMSIKGKARCAAARKLAESIWRLFHYGGADVWKLFRHERSACHTVQLVQAQLHAPSVSWGVSLDLLGCGAGAARRVL